MGMDGALAQAFANLAFADSRLDRAAGWRDDPAALAAALAGGLVLPLWRGRVPVDAAGSLHWVPAGHPVLAGGRPPVLLGRQGGVAHLAVDISDWEPEAGAAAAEAGPFDAVTIPHPALPAGTALADLRSAMRQLTVREGELAAIARALVLWHRSHGFCAACGTASAPAQAGWQRRCPACAATHFPRTDPVVIMLVTRGERTLVGRSPGWPAGMYSCLAGFVEPGETVEAAVRREVAEETGITIGRVTYVASQPWPFPASLMLGCTAEALDETVTPDPAELEDARWIDRSEMVEVMAGTHPEIRPARRGAIAHALISAWLAGRLD
jgi:NAD+ diphosphatase